MVGWEEVAVPVRLMTNSKACPIRLSHGQFGRHRHIWLRRVHTDANAAYLKHVKEYLGLDGRLLRIYACVSV